MVVGKKKFGEDNAADLATNDDIGMCGGRKGEMEITKVDGDWAEGKFFFTVSSQQSNKTVEVTGGFSRISVAKVQQISSYSQDEKMTQLINLRNK